MKITYVTTYDATDLHAWSGCVVGMLKALQLSGFETEVVDNLDDKCLLWFKIKRVLYNRLLSKNYRLDREPIILKHYAKQVEKALQQTSGDVIFSPGTVPIAYLKTEKPIVYWTDATFAAMHNFYPDFTNLCAKSIRDGNQMEQRALSNCRLAIYTSEWARKTAIEYYDVDPKKVKVVPFGTNVNSNRSKEDIETIVENKKFDICRLLFVGVDWYRKGGDLALEVAKELNKRGLKTELTVVGCRPLEDPPEFVKLIPFLSKKTQEGREAMDKLMTDSHFFVLPSCAETYGSVFGEASSFGLPSLSRRVGGITTAIQDGKNGQTFDLDAGTEKYCDYIQEILADHKAYKELALSSFNEYTNRMNWPAVGQMVNELIHEFCG